MEAFAERESLVVRPPHGSHADYVAEAERLLRRDDPAAFTAPVRKPRPRSTSARRQAEGGGQDEVPRTCSAAAAPGRPQGHPPCRCAIAQFADEQEALPSEGMLRYWARQVNGMSLAQPVRTHALELAAYSDPGNEPESRSRRESSR